MSSLLTDLLESTSGALRDIGTATVQGVKEVATNNIQNTVKNKLSSTGVKSTDPQSYAPVTTGTNANGATIVPGLNQPAPAGAGYPKWAIGLGVVSVLALAIGVTVVVVRH